MCTDEHRGQHGEYDVRVAKKKQDNGLQGVEEEWGKGLRCVVG